MPNRFFPTLGVETGPPERIMIGSTRLKAHVTAASLPDTGLFPACPDAPGAG